MRQLILFATLLITSTIFAAAPDKLLGDNFETQTFEMGEDYSGSVRSTLINRVPRLDTDRAILYIHGYNDYFFQADMANRFYDSSYNFYAIDLRRYGRSLDSTQTPFEVRDLKEYFADIDSALMVVRQQGAKEVILMGHSTGGLIASYYCGTQNNDTPPVDGIILNSPFLDMNLGGFMESVLVPIVSTIGRYFPNFKVSGGGSSAYFESIHKDYHGEWDFDATLKLKYSTPITAGWIRAIHTAQKSVQAGCNIEIPILLIYSDKSYNNSEWSPEYQISDSVLDVVDIKKYGSQLGADVTHAQIKDGLHDLVLSNKKAREETYSRIFQWLSELQ
ncbi:MAG: alpha/beta hydrolase [Rikenellaceae bacterium]